MFTMDEMYICEGIVYDKHAVEEIGSTDMGDVTNHLQRYHTQPTVESVISDPEAGCVFAKTILVLVISP